MKTIYSYVLSHLSTELSTKQKKNKHIFRFASKKIFFSGKKFDIRMLLITFKRHHKRYENLLIERSIPSQYRIIYKKHPNFVLLAKNYFFFLAKNLIFKFCLLLSRGITGGIKTVYFDVLSRLSTELSTKKNPNFVLLAKHLFLVKNLI